MITHPALLGADGKLNRLGRQVFQRQAEWAAGWAIVSLFGFEYPDWLATL